MTHNLLLMSDAYKYSHDKQYPSGSEVVEVYIESRVEDKIITFAGLQTFITDYLVGKAFTKADIYDADKVCKSMGIPFNKEGWELMYERHGGRLPVSINAVPEGTRLESGNVQIVITNTDSSFYWLPGFLETVLLRAVWYPSTVATTSRNIKDIIMAGLNESSDNPEEEIMFKLHDFGARGVSSHESANIGGMAHLYNFYGTDTVEAVEKCRSIFQDGDEYLVGASIPAMEHSTVTSWGEENEVEAYKNMLDTYPTGIIAIVIDSYDPWNAIKNIFGKELKERVVNRDGILVLRPDSGDPIETPVKVIEELMKEFGFKVNSKGYRVLPDYIRVLQGDGIGLREVAKIVELMLSKNLSISNIAFGMGGRLLQVQDRDVLNYACKCSAIYVNGKWREVFKNPTTDHSKKSKRGLLDLVSTVNGPKTINLLEDYGYRLLNKSMLELVFNDGVLLYRSTLEEIRERASK